MGRPSKYTSEFRREALELVGSSEQPVAEVARSLGMSPQTLGNWVKSDRERREREQDPEALSESEREELARLRREVWARQDAGAAPPARHARESQAAREGDA